MWFLLRAGIKSWWRHQMETFPRYWPSVRRIHRSPVNSPYKGKWCGALMFSLICVWINGWVNNREAGDLRRYRAHYDVIVMLNHVNETDHRFSSPATPILSTFSLSCLSCHTASLNSVVQNLSWWISAPTVRNAVTHISNLWEIKGWFRQCWHVLREKLYY